MKREPGFYWVHYARWEYGEVGIGLYDDETGNWTICGQELPIREIMLMVLSGRLTPPAAAPEVGHHIGKQEE